MQLNNLSSTQAAQMQWCLGPMYHLEEENETCGAPIWWDNVGVTVLAVMTKAADDVVMFLEGCALETYAIHTFRIKRTNTCGGLLFTLRVSRSYSLLGWMSQALVNLLRLWKKDTVLRFYVSHCKASSVMIRSDNLRPLTANDNFRESL